MKRKTNYEGVNKIGEKLLCCLGYESCSVLKIYLF